MVDIGTRARRRLNGLLVLAVVMVVVAIVAVVGWARGQSSNGAGRTGVAGGGNLPGALIGNRWLLQSWTMGGSSGPVPSPSFGTAPSALFSATQYVADDGCNDTSGAITYHGSSATLGDSETSLVGCPASKVVDTYAAVFVKTISLELHGDTLVVSRGEARLTFSRGSAWVIGQMAPTATPVSWTSVLVGPVWQLATITSGGVTWKAPAGAGSLSFQPNHWAATDGCNEHWGSISYGQASRHQGFTAVEGALSFGPGAQTAASCSEPVIQRVDRMIRGTLTGTLAARLDEGTLTLNVPDAVVTFRTSTGPAAPPGFADSLSFSPSAAPPPASVAPIATIGASAIRDALTRNPWRLTSVTDASGHLPVDASQGARLTMTPDSYLATDGCNRHTGSIAYTDVKVSTSAPTSTRKPCPNVASRIGADFIAVLSGQLRFEFEGDGSITVTTGQTVLAFAKG